MRFIIQGDCVRDYFRFLKRVRKRDISSFMVFLITAVILNITKLLSASISGNLGQDAFLRNVDAVSAYLSAMALIAISSIVAGSLNWWFNIRRSGRTAYSLDASLAKYLLGISYKDLTNRSSGDYLSLNPGGVDTLSSFAGNDIYNYGRELIGLAAAIVFMVKINWVLTLVYLAAFPLIILLQSRVSKPIEKQQKKVSEAMARYNEVVVDALQNPTMVVAYSLEETMEARYQDAYSGAFTELIKSVKTSSLLGMIGESAAGVPNLIVILYSGIMTAMGKMSLAEFIAFRVISESANNWLYSLPWVLGNIRTNMARVRRYLLLTEAPPENSEEDFGQHLIREDAPAIKIKNVSFGYSDDRSIIRDLTLEVPKGKRVALIGPSGCGKSTVMKLLLALYKPDSGDIYINGANANELGLKTLRDQFAYVPQDSFLFPDSIKENILSGTDLDKERLETCINAAGLSEFIAGIPDGIEAQLKEYAENISGGEKQRIATARAFYRNAPIVLFDEATSSLDPITERSVLDTFIKSMAGKTALIVAHRPSAILSCDLIMMMENGKIAASGTHAELLEHSEHYRALFEEAENSGGN